MNFGGKVTERSSLENSRQPPTRTLELDAAMMGRLARPALARSRMVRRSRSWPRSVGMRASGRVRRIWKLLLLFSGALVAGSCVVAFGFSRLVVRGSTWTSEVAPLEWAGASGARVLFGWPALGACDGRR